MIYLIADKNKLYCKIGYSMDNPIGRLKSLQTGMPIELQILTVVEGGKVDEKNLHKKFKDKYIRGEWFHYDSSILDIINLKNKVDFKNKKVKKLSTKNFIHYNHNPLTDDVDIEKPLTEASKKLLKYAMSHKKNGMFSITKSGEIEKLTRTTMWRAILQLLERKLIAKGNREFIYYLNPTVAFKGDRIRLVREFVIDNEKDSRGTVNEPETEYYNEEKQEFEADQTK